MKKGNKKINVKIKNKNKNIDTKEDNDNKASLNNFDCRDKRIGIVFKVIYVITALFVSLFLYIQSGINLNESIIYSGVASFLFWLLFYLIYYVFNELQCLKIGEKSVDEQQFKKTEDSYSFIFTYFYIGLLVHLFLVIGFGITTNYLFNTELNNIIIKKIIFPSIVLASVIGNIKNNKLIKIVSSIFWCVSSFFTFYLSTL